MKEKKKYSKPTVKLFDIRMEEKIAATCDYLISRGQAYDGCEEIITTESCLVLRDQGS